MNTESSCCFKKACAPESGKQAVHHWKLQRLSAYAIIPAAWFMIGLLQQLVGQNTDTLREWMHSTVNAVVLAALLIVSFTHARIGIREIVKDYIRNTQAACAVVVLVDLVSLALGLTALAAIYHLHTV